MSTVLSMKACPVNVSDLTPDYPPTLTTCAFHSPGVMGTWGGGG